ncbi:hypothetical protein [Ereboglobus luteus]|uniref:hypothetical protein n=1 Tax=Ereboglobus luteus TaxID=1796921 RepID=UPI001F1D5F90|nr:hypothetical protein [Ereboglobus luteus]
MSFITSAVVIPTVAFFIGKLQMKTPCPPCEARILPHQIKVVLDLDAARSALHHGTRRTCFACL